ncbi:PREDICTED: Retrovirus-related Pol poly from transposon [Prunus dulcis]|uniref:PREDICTED: Retrovirus-related Pol poly from transposon n=1 Tax=Prunus dulcis TaxID=3755 RepID=A0A5E4G4U5_PRUDU|nr:hypothetical protein L3X38_003429 [Prunus dulcis]VVA34835.1 PREDICTED: Retrovirus-related Pol poly from transposon [Prunus dulcis]
MSQYLKSIKHIVDSLAAAGTPLSSATLVVHTLNGLPAEYHAFPTSIRTRSTPIVIDELHSLLLSEELALLRQNSMKSSFETLPHAFAAVQFGSGSNRGSAKSYNRGRGKSQFHSPNPNYRPNSGGHFRPNSGGYSSGILPTPRPGGHSSGFSGGSSSGGSVPLIVIK